MSLGQIITALEQVPPHYRLWIGSGRYGLWGIFSYRGYYEDLVLTFSIDGPFSVGDGRDLLKRAVGHDFTGWKGGTYRATAETGVWVSDSREHASGDAVVSVEMRDKACELVVKRIDE